ncbi:hypothetical protein BU17DRAFT_69578 [Hysterangium stoloniferum]|nr:hypothetical protein BU17DRAFT_69578 [Hysterangium stoloniferum]
MDIWELLQHAPQYLDHHDGSTRNPTTPPHFTYIHPDVNGAGSSSEDANRVQVIDNQTRRLEEGHAVLRRTSGSYIPHSGSVGTSVGNGSSFLTLFTHGSNGRLTLPPPNGFKYGNSAGQRSHSSSGHGSTAMPACSNPQGTSDHEYLDDHGGSTRNSTSTPHPMNISWLIHHQTHPRDVTGTGSSSGNPNGGHISSGHQWQRSGIHCVAVAPPAEPSYSNPLMQSDYGNHYDFDHQHNTFRQYPMDNPHSGRSQAVPPTSRSPEHLEDPSEGNTFAHRGSFTHFPELQIIEHDPSMVSKTGPMEYDLYRDLAREPEEAFSNMSALVRPPSPPPARPTKRKRDSKPTGRKAKPAGVHTRAFTVSTSLIEAATKTVVFPTPSGKTPDAMSFIQTVSVRGWKKCKRCHADFKCNQQLTRHWLQVHVYLDLEAAINFPEGDHTMSIINSTQRRDILLAAVYTCPLDPCRAVESPSRVAVFVTEPSLDTHVKTHYECLKAWGKEVGQDMTLELRQMRKRVSTYVNQHPFWPKTVQQPPQFTSRNKKLVWMLNQ